MAAAAERGTDLDEVIRVGEKVNSVTRSMGVALTAVVMYDAAETVRAAGAVDRDEQFRT